MSNNIDKNHGFTVGLGSIPSLSCTLCNFTKQDAVWNLLETNNEDEFVINNASDNAPLFADSYTYWWNRNHRGVFTWDRAPPEDDTSVEGLSAEDTPADNSKPPKEGPSAECRELRNVYWKIKKRSKNYYTIRNVETNEYLCATRNFVFSYVYTCKKDDKCRFSDNFLWKLEYAND